MVCQQVRNYHFKQSVSCISLLSVIVLGFYLLWAEWPAIKYHLDSTGILSFRSAGFLFLFIIIMLVVTVFFASVGVSGNHEIHSQIVIPGVVISVLLQCSAIMMMRAWLWPPYVIAGTFLIVQFWNGYLTGWVQRDLNEGRVKTGFWNILSEFWVLIPLVLSGWGLSWGYYTTLFTS